MKNKEFLKLVKSELGPGQNNAEIMAYYVAKTGQTEFKTFRQWKEAGYQVKKGESSYPVFSRPIGEKYFGIAHLFHAGQVEKI
jgi:hypothetical protein